MSRHADFGSVVWGHVLDARAWEHESRARAVKPTRVASGRVTAIYVCAPGIVGIRTPDGEHLTIRVAS